MPLTNNTYLTMLGFIPGSLGYPRSLQSSAIDKYLQGADNPFSISPGMPFDPNGYANISGSFFSRRLTAVLNTAYQTSLCPYGTALGSNANFSTCQWAGDIYPFANGTARVVIEYPNDIYATNKWHASILLAISLLLQLAAFITVIVTAMTRAPNVLGFISSLTRDNPYTANVIPPGGSTLDGAERARALGDVHVRLADLRPEHSVGKIIFLGVDDGSEGQIGGKLTGSGRVYE